MRFENYHPVINLIYFLAVMVSTVLFTHPWYVGVSFVCAFVYSVKLCGKKALVLNCVLSFLTLPWAWWYSFYNHFGITPLRQNFIGNSITLEAAVYGFIVGVTAVSVLMWFECLHAVMSTDKWVYLLGRVSPKASLFLSILLRTVPRIKARFKKTDAAQSSIGRGAGQGNILIRVINTFREASIVLTWSLENFIEVSESMKSRGYTLRGRTSFSLYRFDNRDRAFILSLFACLSVLAMAFILDQTAIQYDPEIIFNRMTPASYVFYLVHGIFCLMPMGVQIIGEARFRSARKKSGKGLRPGSTVSGD